MGTVVPHQIDPINEQFLNKATMMLGVLMWQSMANRGVAKMAPVLDL